MIQMFCLSVSLLVNWCDALTCGPLSKLYNLKKNTIQTLKIAKKLQLPGLTN